MKWNWQQNDWPNFKYNPDIIQKLESQFLLRAGEMHGVFKHLSESDKNHLAVEVFSEEAVKTSEIENEFLNRASVQSSIQKKLGLKTETGKSTLPEQGIAELMVELFQTFDRPLSHKLLFRWHKSISKGNNELRDIGRYRKHDDPMQVVSGAVNRRKVHFEAPPSKNVLQEMKVFIKWFQASSFPALAKAGIAHLYFVSIHPFEDGNGRMARALSEKSLSMALGQPSLIGISLAIQKNRKKYYEALEKANKRNEVTDWLIYFSNIVLESLFLTESLVDFVLSKAKFFEQFSGKLNPRQEKVLLRMFKAGPGGFGGGLSAEKYLSMTKTSRASVTRDLQELVELGALTRTGELRHTRYWLKMN